MQFHQNLMTGIRASQKEKVLVRLLYRTCGSGFLNSFCGNFSGSRGGGVTSVTTCFNEDNKFHGHTNGGTSKGGLVKRRTTEAPPTSPDTVNERSKAPSSKRAAVSSKATES